VHVVHSQTVTSLPDGAVHLAFNAFENVHAFRFGDHAWGVQFHPEFSTGVMTGYLEAVGALAGDSHPSRSSVVGTSESAGLLRRFASYVAGARRA